MNDAANGTALAIDNKHSSQRELLLNGHTAYLSTTNTAGWPSFLIWKDSDEETIFLLFGEVPTEELI